MSDLVRGGLISVPVQDCNYRAYLKRATDDELRLAIRLMEESPKGNKGRITACKKALRERERK